VLCRAGLDKGTIRTLRYRYLRVLCSVIIKLLLRATRIIQ
jgi:hypothetical protein